MSSRFGAGAGARSPLARYAIAVLAVAVAGAVQHLLQPLLGEQFPLAAFPAAVVLAAWFGGFGPGLLATLSGSLAAAYLFLQPAYRLRIDEPANTASLLLFTLVGLLVSAAVRHLRVQADRERAARTDTERQLRQADQLQQLTATLSRARTPADVITTSLPELLHDVEAEAGAVFLISDDGSQCELAHAVGYHEQWVAAAQRSSMAAELPLTDAIRRGDLVAIDTPPADAPAGSLLAETRTGDVIVPLNVGGRAIGAVVLSTARSLSGDDDEREFLLRAGRHMAQALDRARMYETAERARAEAEALRTQADSALRERQKAEEALRSSEARYRTLAARTSRLYALSAGLSEAVTLDAIAKVIVRQGKIVVGAAAGSVAMLVDGGAQFETLYGEEPGLHTTESARIFAAAPGLCVTAAVETERPVFVGSFLEWQEKYPRSASIAADGGYVSSAALPLLADGAVLGVLSLHFTVPVNFDDEYTALLKSVAQHCGQALDRARMYETAERARADAEAANRSKDDFLSTVSHELRTPLNAMLGWAAMLRSGTVDASRTQRALDAIFNNATRQGKLIEELLDVSRIVAGRASFDPQDLDLGENIRGAVEAMMPLAASKAVELRFEMTPGIHVFADPRRLEQVFLNLLSNAVKFTPRDGTITVDAAVSAHSADVRVVDTGTGIEAAFLPHVFERFRQADSAPTRAVGGLGLGLFISRQLVEAQGGTIRAESGGPGCGSTFTVSLPATVAAGPARGPTVSLSHGAPADSNDPPPELDGIRVLLVDDEPDALEVMASALESCGAIVTAVPSMREALEALAQTEVDLLLSDIAMPGQDGYELIREIRAMPSARLASVPAAAVTAHARDDERDRALAAGFHMYLTKPVHPAVLARAVAALSLTTATPPRAAGAGPC